MVTLLLFTASCVSTNPETHSQTMTDALKQPQVNLKNSYQEYVDFFEEVYHVMQDNYYQDILRGRFEDFIVQFDTKIYPNLQEEGKSSDYIKWRSAAHLIDFLKTEEDVFSAFYPPEPAKEYKEEALGQRVDLGIEGVKVEDGFKATQVEPRADAYEKGLRIGDVIVKVNDQEVKGLNEKEILELLTPLIDEEVLVSYVSSLGKTKANVTLTPREYFKQLVFPIDVRVPDVYALEIRRFNRKTSEDFLRFLQVIKAQEKVDGLIIDLRGNPGGPPLAARELSAFFLPGGDEFAYFQRNKEDRAELDVPIVPDELKYDGRIVILINEGSGSASELFSGILQRKGRAVLMGENSAGQVMLKSMFPLEDESMILLITARGHHPDGAAFSFKGVVPDRYEKDMDGANIVDYAATYLKYVSTREKK